MVKITYRAKMDKDSVLCKCNKDIFFVRSWARENHPRAYEIDVYEVNPLDIDDFDPGQSYFGH